MVRWMNIYNYVPEVGNISPRLKAEGNIPNWGEIILNIHQ